MVEPKTKERLRRLELLGVISLALVVSGIFFINQTDFSSFFKSKNLVTGFVSSDIITENLNLAVEQSQDYILSTDKTFTLTSLRLTGSVEGQGRVRVYFENYNGERWLVYTNVQEKKNGNLVTGMAVAEPEISISLISDKTGAPISSTVGGNEELVAGSFYSECLETCFIAADFSPEKNNKLVFELSQGTKVKINSLSFTTK